MIAQLCVYNSTSHTDYPGYTLLFERMHVAEPIYTTELYTHCSTRQKRDQTVRRN